MTAVAWIISRLLFVSGAQQTRSIPGWRLPVTIEVTRDVEVKPTLGVSHEARGTLYSWNLPESKPVLIKTGEQFQMVKIYYEGGCRIRFKKKGYDITSCHWLPGFTDPEADIYRVITPPRHGLSEVPLGAAASLRRLRSRVAVRSARSRFAR